MNILITGGTGLIGSALIESLLIGGYSITLLVRRKIQEKIPGIKYLFWEPQDTIASLQLHNVVEKTDGIINLAGENLFQHRWSVEGKQNLVYSRLSTTNALVKAICEVSKRPEIFISASAVGYYGDTGDVIHDETSARGSGFLAELCERWENEARTVSHLVRLAIPRIGIVLSQKGGALEKITLPYRMFIGTHPGTGLQWFPWIHLKDVVRALEFPLVQKNFSGIYNVVAPDILPMKDFCREVGKVLHRPAWSIGVPEVVLRLLLGESAQVVITGQRAKPARLMQSGFTFAHPEVRTALLSVLIPQQS